jgi:hypothetical protein
MPRSGFVRPCEVSSPWVGSRTTLVGQCPSMALPKARVSAARMAATALLLISPSSIEASLTQLGIQGLYHLLRQLQPCGKAQSCCVIISNFFALPYSFLISHVDPLS